MKQVLLLLVLAPGLAAADPAATLLTVDGKRISGTLTSVVPSAGEAPDLIVTTDEQPLTLKQANLLEMRMANPAVPGSQAEQESVLTLNNGDSVRGELATVTDKEVILRTSFAGDMAFRRDMVTSLRTVTRPTVLFTGPKPDQWTFTPSTGEAWSLIGESLCAKAKGQAATALEYPEKFRLGLDLEMKHKTAYFQGFAIVFLANAKEDSRSGYALRFQSQFVTLSNRQSGENAEPIGSDDAVLELVEKAKVRLELLVDTQAGTITLVVDGRTVDTWTDRAPITPAGASRLLFLSEEKSQEVRASRISLTSWDGNLAVVASEDLNNIPVAVGPTQQLMLRNGDMVHAEHLEIKDGKAEIKTVHGEIRIPTSRIQAFPRLKPPGNPPTPKKMLGDVRGWFPNGGYMTFRLDALKEGKAIGFSHSFGTAEIDLNSFERIEMNLSSRSFQAKHTR
jgi:hypothetical protein